MHERRKSLLATTALSTLATNGHITFEAEDTRDEYQVAYDGLSEEEQSELRSYLPSLQKELFLRRSAFTQIPAEERIELKEITLSFPHTTSPAVQALLLYTFSQEIERVVAEHNAAAGRIATSVVSSTSIH